MLLKIRFKLLRNIFIAIICLGVISVYTYAYLHKSDAFVIGSERKNNKLFLHQFLFGEKFKNVKFNQKTPRNLFASLIYYRILTWSGYYGVVDKAIDCVSPEPVEVGKVDYNLYIQEFTKLSSSFLGLNFSLGDIPNHVLGKTCVVKLGIESRIQNFYLSKRKDGNWYFSEKNIKNINPEALKIYKALMKSTNLLGVEAKYSLPLPAYFRFVMGCLGQLDFTFADARYVMELNWVDSIVKEKYSRFLAFLLLKVLETRNVVTTSVSWRDSPNQNIVLLSGNKPGKSIYLQKKIIDKKGDSIWVFNRKVLNNARISFLDQQMTKLFGDPVWFTCRHYFLKNASFLRYNILGYTAYFWMIILGGLILLIFFYKFFKLIILSLLTRLKYKRLVAHYLRFSKRFSTFSAMIISMYIYMVLVEHSIMFYYKTYLYFIYFITIIFGVLIICWLCSLVILLCSVIAFVLEQGSKERFRITFTIEIIQRLLCIAIILIFSGLFLQRLGVNTIRYLTALGIGGLAVALAGKDTIENLFGSIMIALEKPFKIGDWIIIGDIEGYVEYVGLRSTRILTFQDSYLTVPNVRFIASNVNNMGRRNFRRYETVLDFSDKTSPKLLLSFTEKVEQIIKVTPNIRKKNFFIKVNDIGESSVKILIYVYFIASTWKEELTEREKFILNLLAVVEELDMELQYPSQILYLAKHEKSDHIKGDEEFNIINKLISKTSKAGKNE